ncbi:hypothetical protein VTH06DRAFT_7512 [Thermothelomyces fergusii]
MTLMLLYHSRNT